MIRNHFRFDCDGNIIVNASDENTDVYSRCLQNSNQNNASDENTDVYSRCLQDSNQNNYTSDDVNSYELDGIVNEEETDVTDINIPWHTIENASAEHMHGTIVPTPIRVCKDKTNQVIEILSRLNYKHYLTNESCGILSENEIVLRNLTRNSEYILWSHLVYKKTDLTITDTNIVKWIYQLIQYLPFLLYQYQDYILVAKQLGPSSVLGFLDNISSLVTWFRLVRTRLNSECDITHRALEQFKLAISLLRKRNKKQTKMSKPVDSLQAAIDNKRFPPGLLPQLQDEIVKFLPYIRSFPINKPTFIDSTMYSKFCQIMHTANYAFSPQGRISAFTEMKIKDLPNLLDSFAITNKFKTSAKFGLQAVSLGDIPREILNIYKEFVRPVICAGQQESELSALFVRYDGEPDKDVGRHIINFSHQIGFHISSNNIRSMVEINADTRHSKGEITSEQLAAVTRSSSHSSEAVKEYYLLKNLSTTIETARGAIDWRNNLPLESLASRHTVIKDWGTNHPEYKSEKTRIKFSDDELFYMRNLYSKFNIDNRSLKLFSAAYALSAIKNDPNATAIFHERHVLTTDRLRTGYHAINLLL